MMIRFMLSYLLEALPESCYLWHKIARSASATPREVRTRGASRCSIRILATLRCMVGPGGAREHMEPDPLFGGSSASRTEEDFARARANQPSEFRALEQAFIEITSTPDGRRRYGDPNKGATIQQMWNTQILLGRVANYCL